MCIPGLLVTLLVFASPPLPKSAPLPSSNRPSLPAGR
jgi:hypothetical protein